uniref:Paramyosin-like isoform X1 n=1 Tax=Tanacetum cinerariifolium TaxID=118510 RepID=A0A699IIF8_TANCI|nr:paramyosin-like isoform X1 [Tanacetum cinerariifolium]
MASGGSDPDAKYALSKLLQMGTVTGYQNEFEMLINRVTGIPESLLIPFYISGLKLHLQRELNLVSRPTTLGDVFPLARIIEARFEDTNNQAVDNNGGDKKDPNVNDKQEVKKADDQEIENVKDEERKNVKDQQVSEHTINETADTVTSLQSEVASLDAKESLDANEEIKKDLTRIRELEKQKKKHYKTKCALKIDDEEFKEAKSEATIKIRKLAKVYGAWLPPWLAARLVVFQLYVKNHSKEFLFIQERI